MSFGSTLQRLRASLIKSTGTVVFGMEDGTVSIFGLIFGVAATTTSTRTVVIAGASGAVAAAVSMMAGVYLDAETTNDALAAKQALARSDLTSQRDAIAAALPSRLDAAGLTSEQSAALSGAVRDNPAALCALHVALEAAPQDSANPWEQALWMLLADFAAAAWRRPRPDRQTQHAAHRPRDSFDWHCRGAGRRRYQRLHRSRLWRMRCSA